MITCPPQRATGSRWLRLGRDRDIEAKACAHRRRDRVVDQLTGLKSRKQYNLSDAVTAQLKQQHVKKRRAGDRQQWLRGTRGQRAQSRAEAAAQYGRLS